MQNLGSELRRANAAAASQTSAIAAPAADEVSAAITSLFGAHAQEFQTLSARAAAFHDEFVNLLSGGAAQYVSTEVANVQQMLVNMVNAPAQSLLGGAAAKAAEAGPSTFGGTYNFGPVQVSVGGTSLPSYGGGTRVDFGGTVGITTPFGPLPGTSFQGQAFTTPDGPYAANLYFNTPLGQTGGAIQGSSTGNGAVQAPPTVTSVRFCGYNF